MSNRLVVPAGRPADARRVVHEVLHDVSEETLEIAELLTSELVTNALMHGAGDRSLVVEVDKSSIRVEVHDDDPTVDLRPLGVERDRPHGRGLFIVDALASSWGVQPRRKGKAVWFQLQLQEKLQVLIRDPGHPSEPRSVTRQCDQAGPVTLRE